MKIIIDYNLIQSPDEVAKWLEYLASEVRRDFQKDDRIDVRNRIIVWATKRKKHIEFERHYGK